MVLEEFEAAQEHYRRLGVADRIEMDLREGGHEAHVESGLRFLSKWLKERADEVTADGPPEVTKTVRIKNAAPEFPPFVVLFRDVCFLAAFWGSAGQRRVGICHAGGLPQRGGGIRSHVGQGQPQTRPAGRDACQRSRGARHVGGGANVGRG